MLVSVQIINSNIYTIKKNIQCFRLKLFFLEGIKLLIYHPTGITMSSQKVFVTDARRRLQQRRIQMANVFKRTSHVL